MAPEHFWEKRIEFELPTSFFVNEQVYEMQVVDFPKPDPNYGEGLAGTSPCECEGCTLPPASSGNGTTILQTSTNYTTDDPPPSNDAPQSDPPEEKIIYSAYFRASQYNTFLEKMEAMVSGMNRPGPGHGNSNVPDIEPLDTDVVLDFSVPTGIEPFDAFEMAGAAPLVTFEVRFQAPGVSGKPWLTGMPNRVFFPYQGVLPLIGYGTSQAMPTQAISLTPYPPGGLKITKAHFAGGVPASYSNVNQSIRHYAPKLILENYQIAAGKAAQYLADHPETIIAAFNGQCDGLSPCDCLNIAYSENWNSGVYGFNKFFYDMLCRINNNKQPAPYIYPVRVTYRLPGTEQHTYDHTIAIDP